MQGERGKALEIHQRLIRSKKPLEECWKSING